MASESLSSRENFGHQDPAEDKRDSDDPLWKIERRSLSDFFLADEIGCGGFGQVGQCMRCLALCHGTLCRKEVARDSQHAKNAHAGAIGASKGDRWAADGN
jgi:hypothetical protein